MDVWRGGEGFAHLFDGLRRVQIGAQEETESLFERIEALASETGAFEADGVEAVAARFARRDNFREWKHILGDHGVGADVGVAADAAELLHGRKGADGGVIVHDDVAGESRAIDENCVAADLAVVADVGVGHDQIVIAHAGDAAALHGAAADGAKFAKGVAVTDFERDALARIGEVLRIATDDGKGIQAIIFSEARGAFDDGVMIEDAAVAEFDFVADNRERADADSRTEPDARRNDGMGMNFDHGYF